MEKDYRQAVEWYRKAVEQNYGPAQTNLGICYYNGQGVGMDYAQAVEWCRKTAEQGDAYGQNQLGACYERGHGVPKDLPEAYKFYKLAAEQNQEDAAVHLKQIVTRMTAAEIAEAERRYRQSKESTTRQQ